MMAIRTTLKILGTLALMVTCGVIAFGAAVSFLMNLGLKLHDNYEYYGGFLGLVFTIGSGAIGFVAPTILVWHLDKNSWRVSLRALFIAVFVVAVLLGAYSLSL
jgi:hypothetical protein